MSKKARPSLLKGLLFKALLVATAVGGYYLWQNPELVKQVIGSKTGERAISVAPAVKGVSTQSPATTVNEIVGKTTQLVEKGLKNLKVPKQLSGTEDEVVIEEVVEEFTSRIMSLPQEQVDKVKVQFCQDLLEAVPNASVVVKSD